MVDCRQTSLVQGGLCKVVVVVRQSEIGIVRRLGDLRKAVVDRIS